jgi:hypothetical protein
MEHSEKMFQGRLSEDYRNPYPLDEKFFRAIKVPDPGILDAPNFQKYQADCLERSILESAAKIVVIDNLTALVPLNSDVKEAAPFLQRVQALIKKYGLSVLILCHVPKLMRGQPIDVNHMAGSKILSNLADAIFCIGKSEGDETLRYLKQIKNRHTEKRYGADNVLTCRIVKPENFLKFEFLHTEPEKNHLQKADKGEIKTRVREHYAESGSLRKTARLFNVSQETVRNWI